MPTAYTRRFIFVVSAAVAAAANRAAARQDTDEQGGGDKTFTAGLSVSGNAPATHYICNWAMRPAVAVAIRQRLREEGATVAEVTPIAPGGTPSSTRFAVFDVGDGWTPEAVLAACGLKRVEAQP